MSEENPDQTSTAEPGGALPADEGVPPRRGRARLVLVRLTIALVSTGAALLLIEAGVRLFAPQNISVPWHDEFNGIQCSRPNVHGRHMSPGIFDVTVSINAQRFRGRGNTEYEPAPGVVRIAVLGDSFAFGWGVEDNEAYPAQLERDLQGGPRPLAVEVVNAGNNNTGTGEQAIWYDVWVKRFHPHVVILTVYANDVDDDLGRRLFVLDKNGGASPRPTRQLHHADRSRCRLRHIVNAVPGYAFLTQRSHLLCLLRTRISGFLARRRKKTFAKTSSPAESESKTNTQPAPDRFRGEGLPLLTGEIKWLRDRVQKAGGRLAIVFVPGRETVYPSEMPTNDERRRRSETIVATLGPFCARGGVPFCDTTALLRTQAAGREDMLYFRGIDDHMTASGNRVLAESVAQLLMAEGMHLRLSVE